MARAGDPLRLGVIGAGAIGRRHAQLIAAAPGMALVGIADPAGTGAAAARELGVAHCTDYRELIAGRGLDGVVIAAPNALHGPIGRDCIERGLPVLIEKPIADTLEAGAMLVRVAEARRVPLLVGHHRRFHPMVEATRGILEAGDIGRLVTVAAVWGARKPDDYFAADWRRSAGGGPVLINLIHDIDCLRHFAGEIEEVQAITSNAVREFAVEDTAVVLLRFAGGALGTVTLTDCAPSPWGWESGSGENPAIAASGENCYRFFGSHGALEFPNLVLWRAEGSGPVDWSRKLQPMRLAVKSGAALVAQLAHFGRVIRGEEAPRVSGREGLATLSATLAVTEAARAGRPVKPRASV